MSRRKSWKKVAAAERALRKAAVDLVRAEMHPLGSTMFASWTQCAIDKARAAVEAKEADLRALGVEP